MITIAHPEHSSSELKKGLQGTYLIMLILSFCVCVFFFSSDFLYKSIYCGCPSELHRQADAIQMGTHNICLYEVDTKYTIAVIIINCLNVRL